MDLTILEELLDCATEQLSPAPGRRFVTTGLAPAWDECCDGQVWVRVESLDVVGTRPVKMGMKTGEPCIRTWRATVGIGSLRCAAPLRDDGTMPTDSQITGDAAQVLLDQAALRRAVECCMTLSGSVTSLLLTRWNALGPDGGCVGGEWIAALTFETSGC